MNESSIVESFFLIFTGAALLATLALYARQALLISYILLGVLLGPSGIAVISDPGLIQDVATIGIIFLLFLLGIDLLPEQLMTMLGKALGVTILSSLTFFLLGIGAASLFGFELHDAILIGATMMFSSTIIGLKLLPATSLHHRHSGQVVISILLLQDIMAIIILLLLQGYGKGGNLVMDIILQLVYLPLLALFGWLMERYILRNLIARFDQIHEYIFLLTIGWCLGMAELASFLGLSHEIGAFIAGVAMASSPISLFIAESLKPLRDFFLIMFFFSVGASFDLGMLDDLFIPALSIAAMMLVLKPFIFKFMLSFAGEKKDLSLEVGFRLGQVSEFSLLIAVLALQSSFISERANYLIQMVTMITFIVSSYLIVMRYPTPIAVNDNMRQN